MEKKEGLGVKVLTKDGWSDEYKIIDFIPVMFCPECNSELIKKENENDRFQILQYCEKCKKTMYTYTFTGVSNLSSAEEDFIFNPIFDVGELVDKDV